MWKIVVLYLALQTKSNKSLLSWSIKMDKPKGNNEYIMWFSGFWSLFFCIYITAITFLNIPKENVRYVDSLIGFLAGTIIATIINFWMGASIKQEPEKPKSPPPPQEEVK
jgi:hypothetical protein